MKAVRFLVNFFAVDGSGNRYVKYRQGQVYPSDEETLGQVVAGNAMEVEEGAASQGEIPLEDTAAQTASEVTTEASTDASTEQAAASNVIPQDEPAQAEAGPAEVAEAA